MDPMPLKWEIFHDQKLVHIVAQGQVTLPEMEEHFDALAVADVLQYGKLFDATAADPIYTDQDVMAMGARLSAYTAMLKSGPLAVIASARRHARHFDGSSTSRPPSGRPGSSRPRPKRAPGSRTWPTRSTISAASRSIRRRVEAQAPPTVSAARMA